MATIGIWEKNEGIFSYVTDRLAVLGRNTDLLLSAAHPAELVSHPLRLLVISPGATGRAGAEALNPRMVLLPGSSGPLARAFGAESAVSYGASAKDTITISSFKKSQLCVAIQRELVTVRGGVVERQELVLSLPPDGVPLPYLAAVGTLLLLGIPSEEL